MSDDGPRNKVERLQVAAAVAPSLRENHERNRSRRVALVDRDGNVNGYTTLAEVQKQIVERAKIELDVVEGKRPEKVVCEKCGKLIRTPKTGKVRTVCIVCASQRCIDCGKAYRQAGSNERTGVRKGRCKQCDKKRRAAAKHPTLDCQICGNHLSRSASTPSHPARKAGKPALCSKCIWKDPAFRAKTMEAQALARTRKRGKPS